MGVFRNILYLERGPEESRRGLARARAIAEAHDARLDFTTLQPGVGPLDGHRVPGIPHHDLIITRAKMGSGGPLVRADRVSRALLRDAPCPVWLLHPVRVAAPRLVIAALELDHPDAVRLGGQVLRAAHAVAEAEGAALQVVHAWSPLGEASLTNHMIGIPRGRVRRIMKSMRSDRRARLEEIVRATPGVEPTRIAVLTGEASRALCRYAARVEADIVVLGETRTRGLGRWLFGSVSERIVGRITSSVLVVRTDEGGLSDGRVVEEQEMGAFASDLGAQQPADAATGTIPPMFRGEVRA